MKLTFVTYRRDKIGLRALKVLKRMGHQVRVLRTTESALPGEISLFTASESARFNGRNPGYTCTVPSKFAERGITVPPWAASTPFQVAFRPTANYTRAENFKESLTNLAANYSAWNPWVTPPDAPWNPIWAHGAPPEGFRLWQEWARETVPEPDTLEWLTYHLPPVFAPHTVTAGSRLLVIGCAAFNNPHTDLVDKLLPQKMNGVVKHLAGLTTTGEFSQVDVVVIEGDILGHPTLRRHLHPFMFLEVSEVEERLGSRFSSSTRLWDRTHARSNEEIAEAFDTSASAMERQLIAPLQDLVSVPVERVSWYPMLAPYLNEATALVEGERVMLEAIYQERVKTRPSYQLLHAIDPDAGIERTIGNAALYVAEAMYLRDNPDCIVANFEVHDTYWRGLESLLQPIWGDRVPYIGMAPSEHRQPWGY